MKKQLRPLMNNDGFYLPFALTVTAFVFIFLTTLLYMYQNDLVISKATLQQIEAETFIQMSRQEFMDEMINNGLPSVGKTKYTYPNGEVVIEYEQMKETSEWVIDCTIIIQDYTNDISIRYTIPTN